MSGIRPGGFANGAKISQWLEAPVRIVGASGSALMDDFRETVALAENDAVARAADDTALLPLAGDPDDSLDGAPNHIRQFLACDAQFCRLSLWLTDLVGQGE